MRLSNIYGVNYPFYTDKSSLSDNKTDNKDSEKLSDIKYYKTWRFDEKGNIVYFTINADTGVIVSKEVFENPAKGITGFNS